MSELPEPLTPPDCDLTGMDWMPLHGHRLFRSDFYLRTTDQVKVVAMELWWNSWFQVPAASLPDDDIVIASLAGFSRDLKGWAKIRGHVLHGFVKCNDGRLYHRFLAQEAVVAYERRLKSQAKRQADRDRLQAWRDAKRKLEEGGDGTGNGGGNDNGNGGGNSNVTPKETQTETKDETRFVGGRRDVTLPDQTNKKERKKVATLPARDAGFEKFWSAYPRKKSKRSAQKAWVSAIRRAPPEAIISAAATHNFGCAARFIPYPASWLNADGWLDEAHTGDPVLRAAGLTDAGDLLDADWLKLPGGSA